MKGFLVAMLAVAAMLLLGAAVRELRAINYRLAMANCIALAKSGVRCAEAQDASEQDAGNLI